LNLTVTPRLSTIVTPRLEYNPVQSTIVTPMQRAPVPDPPYEFKPEARSQKPEGTPKDVKNT